MVFNVLLFILEHVSKFLCSAFIYFALFYLAQNFGKMIDEMINMQFETKMKALGWWSIRTKEEI